MRHVATTIEFPPAGPELRLITIHTLYNIYIHQYFSHDLEDLTVARDIAEFEKNIQFARPASTLNGFNVG